MLVVVVASLSVFFFFVSMASRCGHCQPDWFDKKHDWNANSDEGEKCELKFGLLVPSWE